jgi:hypothetical protein
MAAQLVASRTVLSSTELVSTFMYTENIYEQECITIKNKIERL